MLGSRPMSAVPAFLELFPEGVSLAPTPDQGETKAESQSHINQSPCQPMSCQNASTQWGKLRPHTPGFYPPL